jgi:putative tricarboxylic transport membrane protein
MGSVLEGPQFLPHRTTVGHDAARPFEDAFAFGGEGDEARLAVNEKHAERRLELLDACRKGRLGHAALLGGLAEILFPRQGEKEFEFVDHVACTGSEYRRSTGRKNHCRIIARTTKKRSPGGTIAMIESFRLRALVVAASTAATAIFCVTPAAAWDPTRNVEFIVPAGTGGGADQMARMIQGIIAKNNLMKQSMVVINKAGGAGGEGFLDIKGAKANPHKLVITLSNLFTTPLATGIPFSWKEMTPVSMLALDEFVLWVNADSPYKTVQEYVAAIKAAPDGKFKMGGTGSKQEDQIITVAIEKAIGKKMTYVPYKGGGEVAVQLVGNHVDSTVNNPIEAVAQWRAGKLRPLCVFDSKTLPYTDKIAGDKSWADIPTCKSQGLDIEYLMLRGVFMPAGVPKDVVDYYVELFKKVRATPEWAQLMKDGAFNQSSMTGAEYAKWVENEEKRHRDLMKEAGFLATN